MSRTDNTIARDRAVYVFPLVYIGLAALLLPHFWYQMNPDGTSYISIAERYAQGDVYRAINHLWSPLLSWLIAPLLWTGLDSVVAAKLVLLGAGFVGLLAGIRLARLYDLSNRERSLVFALMTLILVVFALSVITPDMLTACILLLYFVLLFDRRYAQRRWAGACCGLLGALAYFARQYNLYFFVAHFTCFNAWRFWRSSSRTERRNLLVNALSGLLVWAALSGTWVGVMAYKYGEASPGVIGKANFAWLNPHADKMHMANMDLDDHGFLEPPYPDSVSMFEDPSLYHWNPWSPFESWADFRHQIVNVFQNVREAVWSVAVLATLGLLLIAWKRKAPFGQREGYLFFTIALYASGYLLVHVEPRYFIASKILALLLAAQLLHALAAQRLAAGRAPRRWPYALYAACFGFLTLLQIVFLMDVHKDTYRLAERLRNEFHVQGNLGSNHGTWHDSLRTAFYLGGHYFGHAAPNVDDATLAQDFNKFNLDYYLVWEDPKGAPPANTKLLCRYREVTGGAIPNLSVFDCRTPPGFGPSETHSSP